MSININNLINGFKERNCMILSIDAKRPLIKSQHAFMIKKIIEKVGYLSIIKSIFDKSP